MSPGHVSVDNLTVQNTPSRIFLVLNACCVINQYKVKYSLFKAHTPRMKTFFENGSPGEGGVNGSIRSATSVLLETRPCSFRYPSDMVRTWACVQSMARWCCRSGDIAGSCTDIWAQRAPVDPVCPSPAIPVAAVIAGCPHFCSSEKIWNGACDREHRHWLTHSPFALRRFDTPGTGACSLHTAPLCRRQPCTRHSSWCTCQAV